MIRNACVSTFGDPRIEAYLQLPEAYRSLSRPSSAPDAKAFALCSYSLSLPIFIVSSLELLEFLKQDFCLSHWKGFSFSCRFSTFRWNCIASFDAFTLFWKDSINFSILSSLICSFLSTHLNPNNLNFFVYLFDCQVSCVRSLALARRSVRYWSVEQLSIASPSWDVDTIKSLFTRFFAARLPGWSVWMDSNHRPRAYQARALATWATDRFTQRPIRFAPFSRLLPWWWRWWDSNPWPPACRAGALPTELHPHNSEELRVKSEKVSLCSRSSLLGLFSQTSIEAWQLNNRIYPYNTNTHHCQGFLPNSTTRSRERPALSVSWSP